MYYMLIATMGTIVVMPFAAHNYCDAMLDGSQTS